MSPRRDAPTSIERLTLRALLRCFPKGFRSTFGPDILDTYRAARLDCASPRERLRLWRRTSLSLIRNGVAERAAGLQPSSHHVARSDDSGAVFMSSIFRPTASFGRDLRLGVRLLGRQPGFTLIALVILAFGIGANTAVFGIINAMLLKPRLGLGDQVVGVYGKDRVQPDTYRAFSYPEYADLRMHTELFASLAANDHALIGLTEGETTRRGFADFVSSNYFTTFGVRLARGRTFSTDEERPGADIPVTVISWTLRQRLGGDDVVGRTVRINQREFTIVGVAPPGFGGSTLILAPELWVPLGVHDWLANDFGKTGALAFSDRRARSLILLARFQPDVTIASATPALDGIAHQLESAHPIDNRNQTLVAARLSRVSVSTSPVNDGRLMPLTSVLLLMSGIVLLVASLNLANMLLARGASRRKEFAIRLALGGGRGQIIRQLLAESFVLSLAGGAAGLVLGWWMLHLLTSSLIPDLPVVHITFDMPPDIRVFLGTFAYSLAATVFFGLGPAWKLAKTEALPQLKDHAGELGGARRARFGIAGRDLLVMGQLALSLTLLTWAGLFVHGAITAAGTDPGFSFDRGIVVNVDSSLAGYDDARGREVYREMLNALRAEPGVDAASLATLVPFGELHFGHSVQLPGAPVLPNDPNVKEKLINSTYTGITSDYFRSLGLSMRRGREFTRAEEWATGARPLALVDEALAQHLFGDTNPIGRQVQISNAVAGAAPLVFDIVGVAPPIRQTIIDAAAGPHLYVPIGQDFSSNAYVHVLPSSVSANTDAAMLPTIRRALTTIDPQLPILSLETQAAFRDRNFFLAIMNAGARMFVAFGAVALVMAVIGVYGVKAYIVARRTREIGIRMALGARPAAVVWMVVREGLTMSAIGLAIGIGLSVLLGNALRGLFYADGPAADAGVISLALVALAGSALIASWLPARRATLIAPTAALRN